MATQADVRRIALALPGARERAGRFAFGVDVRGKRKDFAWVWQERVDPKKPRVPNAKVLAVRVAGADDKALLLSADPEVFFTEPHYDGFPAVLVRLQPIDDGLLAEVIRRAWESRAKPCLL